MMGRTVASWLGYFVNTPSAEVEQCSPSGLHEISDADEGASTIPTPGVIHGLLDFK